MTFDGLKKKKTLTSELVLAEIKIFQLRQFDDTWGDRTYTKPSQKQHHKRDGGLIEPWYLTG